jgi:hypothetical protein
MVFPVMNVLPEDLWVTIRGFLGIEDALVLLPCLLGRRTIFAGAYTPLQREWLKTQGQQQAALLWWWKRFLSAYRVSDLHAAILSEAKQLGYHGLPLEFGGNFTFFLEQYVQRCLASLHVNDKSQARVTTALVWIFQSPSIGMMGACEHGTRCTCPDRVARMQGVSAVQDAVVEVNAWLSRQFMNWGYTGPGVFIDEHWESTLGTLRLELRLSVPMMCFYAQHHKLWPVYLRHVDAKYLLMPVDVSTCLEDHRMNYSCMSGFVFTFEPHPRSPFGICSRCGKVDMVLHSTCFQAIFNQKSHQRFPEFYYMSQGHASHLDGDEMCTEFHDVVIPMTPLWNSFCGMVSCYSERAGYLEDAYMNNVLKGEEATDAMADEYAFLFDMFPTEFTVYPGLAPRQ